MAMGTRMRWAIQDAQGRQDDIRKKREEEAAFMRDIEERKMAEVEANGAMARSGEQARRVNEADDRYSKAVDVLQRNSDAFETSTGRMDPALYNMQYGGGAGEAGKGTGRGGGAGGQTGDPAQDYMGQVIAAYKEAPEGMNGEKEDFMAFHDRYKSQIPQQDPAIDPFEMRRQRNAAGIGDRVTKGFEKDFRFSQGKDGLYMNDRGGAVAPSPIAEAAVVNQISANKKAATAPSTIMPQKPSSLGSYAIAPQNDMQPAPARQPMTLNTPLVEVGSNLLNQIKKRREAGQQRLRTGIYGNR